MKPTSIKLYLILLLTLTFCNKDSSVEKKQIDETDNYTFEDLGIDAPYIYGNSYMEEMPTPHIILEIFQ
tara:strand:- start:29 stop:235 length:207 start_codon:yes stop_codon:yes gene_type:complete